jgi:hypothetical protein
MFADSLPRSSRRASVVWRRISSIKAGNDASASAATDMSTSA